jgi:hypothetical protein
VQIVLLLCSHSRKHDWIVVACRKKLVSKHDLQLCTLEADVLIQVDSLQGHKNSLMEKILPQQALLLETAPGCRLSR